LPCSTKVVTQFCVVRHLLQRGGQREGVAGRHQQPRFVVAYDETDA